VILASRASSRHRAKKTLYAPAFDRARLVDSATADSPTRGSTLPQAEQPSSSCSVQRWRLNTLTVTWHVSFQVVINTNGVDPTGGEFVL
jgi:hypothetical protein